MSRKQSRQRERFAACRAGGSKRPIKGTQPIIAAETPSESLTEPTARQPLEKYPELMRADDVAEIMGTSKQAVYRMSRAGEIPSFWTGSRLFFPRAYFESLIAECMDKHKEANR